MESALTIVFVLSRDTTEGKPKAGPAPSLFYDDVRRKVPAADVVVVTAGASSLALGSP